MAIALRDFSIFVMNPELSALASTYLATAVDRGLLCIVMARSPLGASTFYIPTTIGIWHNMVGVRPSFLRHSKFPLYFTLFFVRNNEPPTHMILGVARVK